jgi:cytochrome P450
VRYDIFDPDVVDGHEPLLDRLRHEEPVAEIQPGIFYVARHEDILEVCRHPEVYRQGRFRPADEDTRTPDQLNLGETDPPLHTRGRKALASALSPPAVRPYAPFVRQVCDDLVGAFAGQPAVDLIASLGVPLPALVIGHVAGIPEADRPALRGYSDDYMAMDTDPSAVERVVAFDDRLREIIRERQASSDRPHDLMTALVEAVDDDGRHLSDEKILTHLSKDVIVGGIETTTHLVGNLFYDLLRTPGAYQRVRDDRSLVAQAVEEALRIRPPVQVLFRQPAEDVELGGVAIPAGSIVALGYASANHDETVWGCPKDFDLDRGEVVRKHLGFGWGTHLCVGAPLARLELASALDAVLDRVPEMRLADGFTYERVRFFMMQGPIRLDVVMP